VVAQGRDTVVVKHARRPWNDVDVRRAVASALSTAAAARGAGPDAHPASCMILPPSWTPSGPGRTSQQPSGECRCTRSASRRRRANSPSPPTRRGFTTSTYTLDFGEYTPETEIIANELKKIGINLRIGNLSYDTQPRETAPTLRSDPRDRSLRGAPLPLNGPGLAGSPSSRLADVNTSTHTTEWPLEAKLAKK
jgi:ABC-type transport system substrate-binding protein